MEQLKPYCEPDPNAQQYSNLVVRSLTYDNDRLAIYLQAESYGFVRVEFQNVRGFRMLDEGDLCAFWDKYHTGNGWLYRVYRGGWFDLESTRQDFITPHLFPDGILEYLVVCDTCVSVLTTQPPMVTDLGYTEGKTDP